MQGVGDGGRQEGERMGTHEGGLKVIKMPFNTVVVAHKFAFRKEQKDILLKARQKAYKYEHSSGFKIKIKLMNRATSGAVGVGDSPNTMMKKRQVGATTTEKLPQQIAR